MYGIFSKKYFSCLKYFEGNFLGYWIEIFGHWKIVFGSIASYLYYFPLSVSYWYGNLYQPIPITIPIRHFPYRQNQYIGQYRYRNCIGRTLSVIVLTLTIGYSNRNQNPLRVDHSDTSRTYPGLWGICNPLTKAIPIHNCPSTLSESQTTQCIRIEKSVQQMN